MSTHFGIATTALGVLERIYLTTPSPGGDEVLVDAHCAALIPVDGYQLNYGFHLQPSDYPRVLGFAGSGIVKAIGADVTHVKVGDRVATLNILEQQNKAAQEHPVVSKYQVAKIPESLPLDQAATIPDNYTTAMYTVFGTPNLAFPLPTSLVPASVLVYGAGSSSGQFLVQAFRVAGCTNILAVASSHHHDHLRTLGAAACFDYHTPGVASHIRAAAARTPAGRITTAVDAVTSRTSLAILAGIFAGTTGARLAVLGPFKDGATVANGRDAAMEFARPAWADALFADARADVDVFPILTFLLHQDTFSRDYIMPVLLPRLLEHGAVRPNAVRLVREGSLLESVRKGVELLSNNKISGEKVVVDLRE